MMSITLFVFGLLVGILLMNLKIKNSEKEDKHDIVAVSQEPSEITRVYIPDRRRVLGLIPRNPYITENFRIDNGFMAYFDENGNKVSHLGVDISYHQDNIDWEILKESNVEFVMLRCGYRGYSEGGLVEDEKFREYATACNELGIPLGVYFFTQAINEAEARREADFVIDLIEDYDISYPIAFDTEMVDDPNARTNVAQIDEELRSNICIAFCEKIKEAGYYPMIYASENWIRRELNYEMLSDYDFWAPQYLDENDFLYDFTIWQYTDKGYVPGIDTEVDIDISMVDYSKFVPALRETVVGKGEQVIVSSNNTEIMEGIPPIITEQAVENEF